MEENELKSKVDALEKQKIWFLKHNINLIQAAFGEAGTMTFGKHSDLGPDLSHWMEKSMEINKYIPHVDKQDVLTWSVVHREEGRTTGGGCTLDILEEDKQKETKDGTEVSLDLEEVH